MASSRIGEILLEKGMITEGQLQEALKIQEGTGKKLGSILIELKYISSRDLSQILANRFKVPSIDLDRYRIKVEMADILPEEYCRRRHVVPLQVKDKHLTVAMSKPNDYSMIRDIEFMTNLSVTPIVAPEGSIDKVIEDLFRKAEEGREKAQKELLSSRRDRDDYYWARANQGPIQEELPSRAKEKELSPQIPMTSPPIAPEVNQLSVQTPSIVSSEDLDFSASQPTITPVTSPSTPEAGQFPPQASPIISDEDLDSFISTEEVLDQVDYHFEVDKDQSVHLEVSPAESHQILQREISRAICQGATYVHFELSEQGLGIKVRVQGGIQTLSTLSRELFQPLIKQLRILSAVDPEPLRHPQTGFFTFSYQQEEIPITAHFFPYKGDLARVVLHLQQSFNPTWRLDNLGFSPEVLKSFREILSYPRGITVFSGPPGNGKTTTIYTALKELMSEKKVIITYESPIRYRLVGPFQIEPEDRYGDGYVRGLSKVLDQDPDILYVDGVNDPRSAQLLFHKSSPYSKIFIRSTLESSTEVLYYFLELLRSPYSLMASLNAILSQRLVNRLCEHCKSTYKPSARTEEWAKALLGVDNFVLYKGNGCGECQQTGFKGQAAIFELLAINEKIKSGIIAEQKELPHPVPSEMVLRKILYSPETVTLVKDGLRRALEGVTTLAEVVRVVGLGNDTLLGN